MTDMLATVHKMLAVREQLAMGRLNFSLIRIPESHRALRNRTSKPFVKPSN
jgi:hypothetical protein